MRRVADRFTRLAIARGKLAVQADFQFNRTWQAPLRELRRTGRIRPCFRQAFVDHGQ
jgi:hypothetical protein